MKRVAIIGGGCSAAIVALNLLSQRSIACEIEIFDPADSIGLGVAYGTKDRLHCLNVPASKMGALADKHDDFFVWLGEQGLTYQAGDFVPRVLYGEYLQSRMREYCKAASNGSSLSHIIEVASCIHPNSSTKNKTERLYDDVVLAIGLSEGGWPRGIAGLKESIDQCPSKFVEDVWENQISGDNEDAVIGILGTGLTAVDVTLSILSKTQRARVVLISRHGLLPIPHFSDAAPPVPKERAVFVGNLRALIATCRDLAADFRWDAVIDAIRPHIPRIWSGFSPSDRERFNRHLRHLWDIHRHRMAPHIWNKLSEWRESERIQVQAGRLSHVVISDGKIGVSWAGRDPSDSKKLVVDRLYNCTGFRAFSESDYGGLLAQMVREGLLELDYTKSGVEPNPPLSLSLQPGLYVMGAILRAIRWESIAVPELREQGQEIAHSIISTIFSGESKGNS
jgi:uncharacterized NAD(P)/FAD-binding protein YdhS